MPQQPESISSTSKPAQRSAATVGAVPTSAFWWQWPCSSAFLPWARNASARPRPRSRTRSSSNRNVCFATALASSVRTRSTVSSRRVKRHEGSSPTIGTPRRAYGARRSRSEEHTSELQSLRQLVCRLLLEKEKEDKQPGGHVR